MTTSLVVAPLLVPLATAVLTLLARPFDALQRGVSVLGGVGFLVAVAALFREVVLPLGSEGRTLVYQVAGWAPPFGISLVADPLALFMLALSAIVSLPAIVFATAYVTTYGQRLSFHPLYHFMMAGVAGSFLTGDLFNLFVWFEVMLMASYVLVVFYSGPEHTRAALNYVILNLVGSAILLLAIGGIYATTGTLNLADLARRLGDPGAYGVDVAPVLGLAALLFVVFALKAGLVPFQFWVPAAYRAAPAPVTAVLAGVVKKVGVYAILRLYFTVFAVATLPDGFALPGLRAPAGGEASFLAFFGPVLFVTAVASILFGGLGAIGQRDIDGLLAYSSIGQVGFIVVPLAVVATLPAGSLGGGTSGSIAVAGVTASLVYAFNHALAKGLLFLASGTIHSAVRTVEFDRLGGLARRAPVLAAAFLVGALSLVGIPPLLGFFGKFLVLDAAARAMAAGSYGAPWAIVAVLVGAILTIAYVSRAWNRAFWGEPGDAVEAYVPDRWGGAGDRSAVVADGGDRTRELVLITEVTVVASMAVAILGFGIGFEAVVGAAESAARAALDTERYVDAVDPQTVESASGALLGGGSDLLREVVR